mmetsp:Transcript_29424/g.40669  ORF Transcript_29424/g.40669 Transcript_29424/m.40669 type:complete len:103 (+) Transcript_29424:29-337(+)
MSSDNLFDRKDPRKDEELMDYVSLRLFIFGFFGLPFLWIMNFFYFFGVQKMPASARLYVMLSGVFGGIAIVSLIGWMIAFDLNYNSWGSFGDSIAFRIPYGS